MEKAKQPAVSVSPQPQGKRGRPRWTRRALRAVVWLGTLLLLGLLACFWSLEHRGLPAFAKHRIVRSLSEKGVELEFSNMRWVLGEGIKVEDVTLFLKQTSHQSSLNAESVQIGFHPVEWFFRGIRIEEALIHGGRLRMPVEANAGAPSFFEINGVNTLLRLHSKEWWQLDFFKGQVLGLEIALSGSITHPHALSSWSPSSSSAVADPQFGNMIEQIVQARKQLDFESSPEIRLHVDLDARNPGKSAAKFSIRFDGIGTKTLNAEDVLITARIPPHGDEDDLWHIEWHASWDKLTVLDDLEFSGKLDGSTLLMARSGKVKAAEFNGTTGVQIPGSLQRLPVHVTGDILAPSKGETSWRMETSLLTEEMSWTQAPVAKLARSECKIRFDWPADGQDPWGGDLEAVVLGLETPWGSMEQCKLQAHLAPSLLPLPDSSRKQWAWWAFLAPYSIGLEAQLKGITGPLLEASEFEAQLQWDAPTLDLKSLTGSLYQGRVNLVGSLDIPSRKAILNGVSSFDARRIRPLLSSNGKRWIDQYEWLDPPRLKARLGAILPDWRDSQPDWRGQVKPTLSIDGYFEVDEAHFRGVPVDGASSDILFEDMHWRLPNLTIRRPEGITRLGYTCDARTQDYHWSVNSTAQPKALRPLLNDAGRKVLSELEFPDPVELKGTIWGRWHHLERTGAEASLKAGRMHYRGQPCLSAEVSGSYTNQFFKLFNPVITRKEGTIRAAGVGIDALERYMTVTNVVSHIHPMAVARAIGPRTAKALEPYRFAKAPSITMSGRFPFGNARGTTAHFDVRGGPFSYWKFHVPSIESQILWDRERFTLKNLGASFYGGDLQGEMRLLLLEEGGASFALNADLENVRLGPFLRDMVVETKESEGFLSGQLRVTSAETDDWGSWQGHGTVSLREGQLWDTPLFGVFSRLMNAISPGLGNSQAAFGDAGFTITDSLIETPDMEIRERTARLKYRGSVDFDGHLDARVEAELLRDAPMLGKVFSMALWPVSKLFEYKVNGALGTPDIQPLYILPKYLLVPFQSLGALDNWLLSENGLLPVQRLWTPLNKSEKAEQEEDKINSGTVPFQAP
jgi:hypothetical protein